MPHNATEAQIKSAYRRISVATHENGKCVDPDRFRQATEASNYLLDPDTTREQQERTKVEIKKMGKSVFLFSREKGPFSKAYDEIYSHGGGLYSAYRQDRAYLLNGEGVEVKGPFKRITQRGDKIIGIQQQMVWLDRAQTRYRFQDTEEELN